MLNQILLLQKTGGVFIGKYHEEVVAHINKNSSFSGSAKDLKEKFEQFVDPDKWIIYKETKQCEINNFVQLFCKYVFIDYLNYVFICISILECMYCVYI